VNPVTTDSLLRGLDPEQRAAVTTDAAPLAIIAAAGSGKTTVLTRRIAHRIITADADAQHVLALTFTRDAAAEMKRRLRALDIRGRIEAGTFHAVALRLLRDHALSRNAQPPQVASDRARLIREVVSELKLPVEPMFAMADLDWARARRISSADFDLACRDARRRSPLTGRMPEVTAAYERVKRRRGVVDFDDLLTHLLDALDRDIEFRAAVHWRFRHVFVDEAQDLNPLQHDVLHALLGRRADVCLVGDPRQAIYGWNGADPRFLADVDAHFPGVTVLRLTTNYRCSPQVVRAAAAVLAGRGGNDDSASAADDGPSVSVEEHADEAGEAAAIAAAIRSHSAHRSLGSFAVLARTNDQLTDVERALAAVGIATERAHGRSPLHRLLADVLPLSRERLADWVAASIANDEPMVRRVAEEADRYLSSGEAGNFRAWVEARQPFDEFEPQGSDAVSVTTFHAAKGREWWGVWIVGVETGLVPHFTAVSDEQLDEETRLLYVGLTRAAAMLTLTAARRRKGHPTSISPLLEAVTATIDDDAPAPPPATMAALRHDPLAALRQWRHGIARVAGSPDRSVCSDRTLQSLLDDPPAGADELAARLGISPAAAARLKPLPETTPQPAGPAPSSGRRISEGR
jgi:DNA helicase II / ATP-dependent DNA helicase PcrA